MRYAVILAGGGGTRLWPASRRQRPKQLLALGARADESLLAATVRRLSGVVPASHMAIVTAATQTDDVRRALHGAAQMTILGEPAPRNTAAAVGLAAVHLLARDPEAVLGVLPSDHHVTDELELARVLDRAYSLAETRDAIVTIGVRPTHPETGFGYLELGDSVTPEGDAREVIRFVEKPDRATAEDWLAGGNHLWNGGMFFFRAARVVDEIRRHLPALASGLDEIARAVQAGDVATVTQRVYPTLPAISIDHGVMEKTAGIVTVPGDFGWSDVGSWSALAEVRPAGEGGNVTAGDVLLHDARDNIVLAEPGVAVALVGVEGLVVVQAGDGILVVPRARAQDVKHIVRQLEDKKLDTYL